MRDRSRSGPLRAALDASGVEADVRALDVSDDVSVVGALSELADEGIVPDVVVSNAGIGVDGTLEELTLADFRAAFETNVLGAVRLLHALMPRWRQRGSGRFIAVSSTAGVIGVPFSDAYCMSKFALEGMLEAFHPIAAAAGVSVSLVEPGPITGEFIDRSLAPDRTAAITTFDAARARFQLVQDQGYESAQSNEDVARVLWAVATAEAPALRHQTSETVARLLGVKLKDLSGERVTGMTARWI